MPSSFYEYVLKLIKNFRPVNIEEINLNKKEAFIINNVHIKDGELEKSIKIEDGTILIDPLKLEDESKNKISREDFYKQISQGIQKDDYVLDDTKKHLLEDLKKEKVKPETIDDLNFFREILPHADLMALRISIFIKHKKFDEHEDIRQYRTDLKYKYGERGLNISNLYSQDYFDDLKHLYTSYKTKYSEKEAKEKFLDFFDTVVVDLPSMVFINRWKKRKKFKKEILTKAKNLSKYGLKYLRVHAVSKDNIEKAEKIVEDLKSEGFFEVDSKFIDQERLTIKLIINKDKF